MYPPAPVELAVETTNIMSVRAPEIKSCKSGSRRNVTPYGFATTSGERYLHATLANILPQLIRLAELETVNLLADEIDKTPGGLMP